MARKMYYWHGKYIGDIWNDIKKKTSEIWALLLVWGCHRLASLPPCLSHKPENDFWSN